ncbi:MAG: tRNA guanosine(34) transglycosylase Tgt [Deltaproteobacteria bacterium]|jgi:queuine tRNA-ribosyltransferase|nr:tRNA guanosine(34) transglycosylase Tgt [Deltaproteobacteria bacterium]
MEQKPIFSIEARDASSRARAGTVTTAHGTFPTPAFMPVGTRASVKAVDPRDLRELGATIVLSNTFHLMLRPGAELIASLGGLHAFMGWDGPILTDSGGFQVYSLAGLRKLSAEGLEFRSPYDGGRFFFTPERAVEVQTLLGSDIMMCLDECTPYPASEAEAEASMGLTLDWARRSKAAWRGGEGGGAPQGPSGTTPGGPPAAAPGASAEERGLLLFGICQGGFHRALRERSAADLAELGLPGYAAGGLALGEPREVMLEAAETSLSVLPEGKPRYLMGLGTPQDVLDGIRLGADMFDCVIPTRNARNGQLFTRRGPLNIRNSRFRGDPLPPDPDCGCLTCRSFSRAYLRHLQSQNEPLFPRLATVHNLAFYQDLVRGARKSLLDGSFACYHKQFLDAYASGSPD